MENETSYIIAVLWIVGLIMVVAAGLWTVALIVILLILGGLMYNKSFNRKIEKIADKQQRFAERVDSQLDATIRYLAGIRSDINRGLWTIQTKSGGSAHFQSTDSTEAHEPNHVDLASKIIEIENRLNKLSAIVEQEEEPA